MPHLYIIAGPNGSGKSLFSKELVAVDYTVFDGDYHIGLLKREFPETGSDILEQYVNDNAFKEAKDKAISEQKDFAFETNFSAADPLVSQRQFREAGYQTHLVFIGLETLQESVHRVDTRVRQGGHKVSEGSIKYNFTHGLDNLLRFYDEFDEVVLLSNPVREDMPGSSPVEMLKWNNQGIILSVESLPEWANKFIDSVRQKHKTKNTSINRKVRTPTQPSKLRIKKK